MSLVPQSNKAEWHITYQCDLNCVHCNRLCFLPPQTPDMAPQDAIDFIGQAHSIGWRPTIIIIGGEPTLHPQFWEFVGLAAGFNAGHVEVWSNGYSDHAKECLRQLREDGRATVVEATIKSGSVTHAADDIFLAPVDFGESRGPCWCHASSLCGVSVDSGGFSLCPCGGAFDGVLRAGVRTKRLADLFDEEWAAKHTKQLCRLCGHAMGIDERRMALATPLHGSLMSPTWANAVRRIDGEHRHA